MEDFLKNVLKLYVHPSIALWRSIELKEICEFLETNKKLENPILDLGCGEGIISKLVWKSNADIGLDIENKPIFEAMKLKIFNNFVIADAQNLPFKDDYFNTIFSNCVIEHIPDNFKVLEEISRVLKKGGIFIFTVPSNKFVEYLFFYNLFKYFRLQTLAEKYSNKRNELLNHFHCYKLDVWENRLNGIGLQVIYTKYYISKKTIMLWDFLAAIVLFLDKLFIWKVFLKMCKIFPLINKLRIWFFYETLKNHYNIDSDNGGALLIVAKKRGVQ